MACRFAQELDGGRFGRPRALAVHLTCPACGGHHADSVAAYRPSEFPLRGTERLESTGDHLPDAPDASTHQCRDCGTRWVEPAAASSSSFSS